MKEYSVREVAELLDKDSSTIRRWVDKGYFGEIRRDGFGPTSAIMISEDGVKDVVEKLKVDVELN